MSNRSQLNINIDPVLLILRLQSDIKNRIRNIEYIINIIKYYLTDRDLQETNSSKEIDSIILKKAHKHYKRS